MTDRRTIAAIATSVAVAVGIFGSCVDPNVQSSGAQPPRPADDQPIVLAEGSGPAPAAAPQPAAPVAVTAETVAFRAHDAKTGNVYFDRFAAMWNDIHNPANGYFSPEGIPYHSVETLMSRRPTTATRPRRRRTATGCGSRRPTAG